MSIGVQEIVIGSLAIIVLILTIVIILYGVGVIGTKKEYVCPAGFEKSEDEDNVCIPTEETKKKSISEMKAMCISVGGTWNDTSGTCFISPTGGTTTAKPPSTGGGATGGATTTKPPSTGSGTTGGATGGTTTTNTPSTGTTTTPTTDAINLTPCKIKGVLIKEPWYQSPDSANACRAPLGQKCCARPNGDDPYCVANFSDPYYSTQQSIIDWAKTDCGVDYSIDALEGCPDGYTSRDAKGRCTMLWSSTCDDKCAKQKCETANGGRWIPLDYTNNPYTCDMPRDCPKNFTGKSVDGKCYASIPLFLNDETKKSCENAGGVYSFTAAANTLQGGIATCNF
jgi:hypothetical protein